jgi:hypothetical protein
MAVTFVGGFLGMAVGVLGAWSANGFDFVQVMSAKSVMPVESAVWGSVGIILLAVFVAILVFAQRANSAEAAVFDAERASLWVECGDSLSPIGGFSGEAEDVVGPHGGWLRRTALGGRGVLSSVRDAFGGGTALAAGLPVRRRVFWMVL